MPTSLADEIAFRLEKEILEGAYRPGQHLLQDAICERFGVSRTPVREALRKLQAQHLVTLVPNRGAAVRIPEQRELAEIYDIRAELEGFACALAAERIRALDLEELDAAQALIDDAHSMLARGALSGEAEVRINAQITKGNEEFHAVIHRSAANQRLVELLQSLQSFFPKDYVWRAIWNSPNANTLNIDDHRAIRDALARGERDEARRTMSEHIQRAGVLLIEYLTEHGFWDIDGPGSDDRRGQ